VRKYGLAADSVRWIEIVTPDGVLRRASPTENSELFWGLRGGGGNFGVVTAMEFDLYPVSTLYGGNMAYPGNMVSDVLHFFREWVKNAPDELTSAVQVIKFPSFPAVPGHLRGKNQVIVRAAYTGDSAEGAKWIQKWLDWCPPLNSTFREMPFSEVASISQDPVDPTPGYGSNATLNELSDGLIDVILQRMTDPASPLLFTEIRHAGGAMARSDANTSAVGSRDAEFFLQTAGQAPTPELITIVKNAIHDYKDALRPYVRGGVYLNFMKGDEAAERARDGYLPESYNRLVALKQQYDPQNLFRFSYQLVGR
jgi:FAD/FMN-containing dehydrogenase